MVSIPKYVYTDLKNKASSRLDEKKAEIYEHFKSQLQKIGDSVLNTEKKKFKVLSEYKTSIGRTYDHDIGGYRKKFSGDVEISVDYDHQEVYKKIEKAQEKIRKKIGNIFIDLETEYETWQLNIFIKASDGQLLSIPDFKVDYSKY